MPAVTRMLGTLENGMSPCFSCKKACGGCDWSRHFKPVKGWEARPHVITDKTNSVRYTSYEIAYCPEFVYEGLCSQCRWCPKEQRGNSHYSDICPKRENTTNRCMFYRHWKYGYIIEE